MLINMNEMLNIAEHYNFCVGAFNVTEVGNFKSVFGEAERLKSPAIIQVNAGELAFAGTEFFGYIRPLLMNSRVPYVLHLDHGKTIRDCLMAVKAGFTSVMIDGSLLPFQENVELTKQAVAIAHQINISVEGELGTIGEALLSDEGGTSEIKYTEPEEAEDFVEKTGIDCLAVAIGTSHGFYPKGFVPKLQLDRLKEIKKRVNIPLVLHGGSNNPDEEIAAACRLGVRKVNISTDYKSVYAFRLNEQINADGEFKMTNLIPEAVKAAQEVIQHKMEIFDSIGKAKYYYEDL